LFLKKKERRAEKIKMHTKESYREVLNDLMERRARIDAAITAIREIAMTNGSAFAEPEPKKTAALPDNRAERAEVIRKAALRLAAKPDGTSAGQIRDVLDHQGDSRNIGTIRSCLVRLVNTGKLVKIGFGTYKLGEPKAESVSEEVSPETKTPEHKTTRRATQLQDLVRGVLATSTAPMRLRDITAALAKVATPPPSMENVGSTLASMTRKGELTRVSAGLYRISSE
jgi:hypothetical protein